jgi:hypothetical protein
VLPERLFPKPFPTRASWSGCENGPNRRTFCSSGFQKRERRDSNPRFTPGGIQVSQAVDVMMSLSSNSVLGVSKPLIQVGLA